MKAFLLNMGVFIAGFGVLGHVIHKIQKANTEFRLKSNEMRKRMVQRESEKAKRDERNRLWWNKMKLFYDSNVLFLSPKTRITDCVFEFHKMAAEEYYDVEDMFIVNAFVNEKPIHGCIRTQNVLGMQKTGDGSYQSL